MTSFKKNNLPPYFEEVVIPETNQIETILTQFQQLVPTDFVQLLEINYMCSTNPRWNKPLCERYTFLHNGDWLFLDIPHNILEKLELSQGKEISYPIYLEPNVLNKELSLGAYTIDNESEIFLQKPLSEQNLASELRKWLAEINLAREKETNKLNVTNLQDEQSNRIVQLKQLLKGSALIFQKQIQIIDALTLQLETEQSKNTSNFDYQQRLQADIKSLAEERKDLVKRIKKLKVAEDQNKTTYDQEIVDLETQITNLKEWKNQLKFELVPFFWTDAFYTNDTPAAEILIEKIKELVSEKDENKRKLQTAQDRIGELEREKGIEEQTTTGLRSQIDQKDTELTTLIQEKNQVRVDLATITTERDIRPNITIQQWNSVNSQLIAASNIINQRNSQISSLNSQINNIQDQLTATKIELAEEKGWWDKWIHGSAPVNYKEKFYNNLVSLIGYMDNLNVRYPNWHSLEGNCFSFEVQFQRYINHYDNNREILNFSEHVGSNNIWPQQMRKLTLKEGKMFIKAIYQCYRDE